MRVGTGLDYFLIIAYFVLMLGFGSLFSRFTKSTKDFFLGGQRFSWWLIAFSCVATTVGSYSFYKYSAKAFSYGLSSTMTYLNDWFWLPLWLFAWLPVVYFMRITSVPEYFDRRFDRPSRMAATVILLVFMVGYVGINLLTLGKCLNVLLGWPVFWAASAVAVVTGVYVMAGGQTSVIMTDLLQGFLLLVAGFALFFLGLDRLSDGHGLAEGMHNLYHFLPKPNRYPFAGFNRPADFNSVGIFWQDAMVQGIAFYFLNQGFLMRFLSARSVREGRKAALFILIVLMPVAAVAVSNAGWLGRAMAEKGIIDTPKDLDDTFVVVAAALCRPGVFGLVLAALTAALMSTADTLINAVAAVTINDIYRPYVAPGRTDRHYLAVSRIVSIGTALLGLALVPVFASFESIYVAHATFTAAVTPPMGVALLLGLLWKRFTPRAALWTMIGGSACVALSFLWPELITPFAHGTPMYPDGAATATPWHAYSYIRALYALVVSAAIGVTVTFFSTPRPYDQIEGLTWAGVADAMRRFKGGEPNTEEGKQVRLRLFAVDEPAGEVPTARVDPEAMKKMKARPGDLAHVRHGRSWFGGLRSVHVRLGEPTAEAGTCQIPAEVARAASLHSARHVVVDKVI